MIIRRLMRRHLPAVADHFRRLPAEDIYLRFIQPVSMEWIETIYLANIDFASHVVLGAFEGEEIVGFCHVAPHSKEGFVELGLSIDMDWRQKGLGSKLIGRAKTYAKILGYSELRLQCARNNFKMIRLAKKHGIAFHSGDGEVEGAAPLQVIDMMDLTGAIQDEQTASALDVWQATVSQPMAMFQRLSEDLTNNNLQLQRRLLAPFLPLDASPSRPLQ